MKMGSEESQTFVGLWYTTETTDKEKSVKKKIKQNIFGRLNQGQKSDRKPKEHENVDRQTHENILDNDYNNNWKDTEPQEQAPCPRKVMFS